MYRCEAEVGSVKRGWRSCGRKAKIRVGTNSGMLLCYCFKHESRGAVREPNKHNSGAYSVEVL